MSNAPRKPRASCSDELRCCVGAQQYGQLLDERVIAATPRTDRIGHDPNESGDISGCCQMLDAPAAPLHRLVRLHRRAESTVRLAECFGRGVGNHDGGDFVVRNCQRSVGGLHESARFQRQLRGLVGARINADSLDCDDLGQRDSRSGKDEKQRLLGIAELAHSALHKMSGFKPCNESRRIAAAPAILHSRQQTLFHTGSNYLEHQQRTSLRRLGDERNKCLAPILFGKRAKTADQLLNLIAIEREQCQSPPSVREE